MDDRVFVGAQEEGEAACVGGGGGGGGSISIERLAEAVECVDLVSEKGDDGQDEEEGRHPACACVCVCVWAWVCVWVL